MCSTESATTLKSNVNLVEQILEQGQRLRNSMVKAILDNDPFNVEGNLENKKEDTERCESLTTEEKHRVLAYLRGEHMSRHEEKKVLDTFRALSGSDIVDITSRSYHSDYSCNCDTCKAYYKHNLSCDFNHSNTVLCKERHNVPPLELHKFVCPEAINDLKYVRNCLKYVDSLKISVCSVSLNQEGIKKIYGSSQKIKMPMSMSHTYFIEYHIPNIISRNPVRKKSKVDSGLDSNLIRMCSKRIQNEVIYFKQISMHDICNLEEINLSTVDIKFQVSCRTFKQKTTNILGSAKFNLKSFLHSKKLTVNEELPLMLHSDAPISIGKFKVSLNLGCSQLYFGEEFLNAIRTTTTENTERDKVVTERQENDVIKHVNTEIFYEEDDANFKKLDDTKSLVNEINNWKVINGNNVKIIERKGENKKDVSGKEVKTSDGEKVLGEIQNVARKPFVPEDRTVSTNDQILFGFFCVTEARFVQETSDTYVTFHPFSKDDILYSRLVHQSSSPIYNFHQVLPFIYNDDFLNNLRDNFVIFEFFNKTDYQEDLIGVVKVSLHQFYVSFRNRVITKYLERNTHPVIGCDWWEPILDPLTGEIFGQAQILVALGTELQIHNLRLKRGFENESVIAKSICDLSKFKTNKPKPIEKKFEKVTSKSANSTRKKDIKKIKKIDIGVQSDFKMSEEKLENTPATEGSADKPDENFGTVASFLKHLMDLNTKNTCVENSTNTETPFPPEDFSQDLPQIPGNIRSTSDLFDSLQEALSISNNRPIENSFKARIFVESALHLPGRKKSKAKKSRNKHGKTEEILPSTYVSFETIPNQMQITSIVQKNKNPVWNYNCETELPVTLLVDNEKRMIFKVWKKSNNCSTTPNPDLDSILGFAGVDLTVLMAGLPTVSGWFNILDFSSKCNGQIKITVTPLENIHKFSSQKLASTKCSTNLKQPINQPLSVAVDPMPEEEPGELLSRALKRKFTELDEITQRLRLRLSHVTNDESDGSNDEIADQFERDINTLCIEDDFDMINFETEPRGSTQDSSGALLQVQNDNFIYKEDKNDENAGSGNCVDPLDRHLVESRLKLDSLFEKLALLTHQDQTQQVFNSGRHVSGCSVSNVQEVDSNVCSSSSTSLSSCVQTRLAPDGGNK